MGLSLIPQPHGGALLSGGKPGNPGHNQHTGTYGGIDRTAVSTGVGARVGLRKHRGSAVHHVFEMGDKGQGNLLRLMELNPHSAAGFSVAPKMLPDGSRLRPFEAADLRLCPLEPAVRRR